MAAADAEVSTSVAMKMRIIYVVFCFGG
jgi:hypothetical protein